MSAGFKDCFYPYVSQHGGRRIGGRLVLKNGLLVCGEIIEGRFGPRAQEIFNVSGVIRHLVFSCILARL